MSCKNCVTIYHTKSVLLPEEGEYVNFKYLKKLTKAPYIIFECVLISSTDNFHSGPKP